MMVKKGTENKKDASFWELRLNPRYTFEEFVVGPNNRFTHAAALAVTDNPGKIYNPLFIYGGVGLGKTHLMQAIGHQTLKKNSAYKILYVTTEKFTSEVIEAIRQGTIQSFRDRYRELDLLLVDDVQFLAESEATQEEFFHTFNILYENGKQIVLSSDRPPKQLTTLEDRVRSRFEWGLITDIKPPNLETRIAILKKKNEHENLNIDEEILKYIASRLTSNIRELEGFLKRLHAYADINKQEIDLQLVKELMGELIPAERMVEEKEVTAPETKPVPPPPPPPSFTPKPGHPPSPAPVIKAAKEVRPVEAGEPQVDLSLRPVEVAFFYPEGKIMELQTTKTKFAEMVKKHKLKFRLESVFEKAYNPAGKINYPFFTELCKTNKVNTAIVISPPAGSDISSDEFLSHLSSAMDSEKIFLLWVPFREVNKDYLYLNLALDITLIKCQELK